MQRFSIGSIFGTKVHIITCYFHFQQALVKKLNSFGLITKKYFKDKEKEFMRNFSLLCFIDPSSIDKRIELIKKEFTTKQQQQFIKYFINYWIKRIRTQLWNYANLVKLNKGHIDQIFITNNAVEVCNKIINANLPSGIIKTEYFIKN